MDTTRSASHDRASTPTATKASNPHSTITFHRWRTPPCESSGSSETPSPTDRLEATFVPTRGDLRTDLIVTGKASYLQDTSEYDLTVRSMYSQGIDYEAAPFAGLRLDSEPTEIFKSIQSKLQKTLDKHAQDKTRKYKEVCRNIFFPLVLSVGGGTFATETVAVFDHWKDVMGKTRYRFLTTDMSIGLLRAKSFSFIL